MKTALIQQKFYGNKTDTVNATTSKIQEAAKNGAELIVLQELHQSEYFCQSEDTGFFDYAANFEEDVAYWAEVARENAVVLVTSLFERRTAGSTTTLRWSLKKMVRSQGNIERCISPMTRGFTRSSTLPREILVLSRLTHP